MRCARRRPALTARLTAVLITVLVTTLLQGALTAPVGAYHDEEQFIVTDTAYTLREDEWRLGLWRVDYGLRDDLYMGTYTLPWLVLLTNLQAKWRFLSENNVDLAARIGLFWLDLKKTRYLSQLLKETDSDARFVILPVQLDGSYRFDEQFSLTVAPVFTVVALSGDYNAEEFEGAAAVSNLQLTATFEARVSRVTALIAHGRFLVYQHLDADTSLELDEFTSAEVHGKVEMDVRKARSLTLAAVFSWETFNFRIGVGYGNYNIPSVNIVLPVDIPFPELDLYWRF